MAKTALLVSNNTQLNDIVNADFMQNNWNLVIGDTPKRVHQILQKMSLDVIILNDNIDKLLCRLMGMPIVIVTSLVTARQCYDYQQLQVLDCVLTEFIYHNSLCNRITYKLTKQIEIYKYASCYNLTTTAQASRKFLRNSIDQPTPEQLISLMCDPTIAINAMRIANLGCTKEQDKSTTLREAIFNLDLDLMRKQVSYMPIAERWGQFNRFALLTAIVAKHIAVKSHKCHPEVAFVTGIMHNFGIRVLDNVFGQQYKAILNSADSLDSLQQLEKQQLTTTHGQAGYLLLQKFNIPSKITQVIQNYSCSFNAMLRLTDVDCNLLATVNLAVKLSCCMGLTNTGLESFAGIETDFSDFLGLTKEYLQQIVAVSKQELPGDKPSIELPVKIPVFTDERLVDPLTILFGKDKIKQVTSANDIAKVYMPLVCFTNRASCVATIKRLAPPQGVFIVSSNQQLKKMLPEYRVVEKFKLAEFMSIAEKVKNTNLYRGQNC